MRVLKRLERDEGAISTLFEKHKQALLKIDFTAVCYKSQSHRRRTPNNDRPKGPW